MSEAKNEENLIKVREIKYTGETVDHFASRCVFPGFTFNILTQSMVRG